MKAAHRTLYRLRVLYFFNSVVKVKSNVSMFNSAVTVLCSGAACRILASCTELMQAIKELVLSSKDLQRDIVESGRVSPTPLHSHTTIGSCSCHIVPS